MIEFNTCCFCVPLRTGCLILGYLHLIASTFLGFVSIMFLVGAALMANSDKQVEESVLVAFIAVYVILLILATALLTFSVLLVVGIHKERRGYVKAYLIYYSIFIILYTIIFIVSCATQYTDVVYIISTLIEILLSVYFLLVIRSYWAKTLTVCSV